MTSTVLRTQKKLKSKVCIQVDLTFDLTRSSIGLSWNGGFCAAEIQPIKVAADTHAGDMIGRGGAWQLYRFSVGEEVRRRVFESNPGTIHWCRLVAVKRQKQLAISERTVRHG
jgi:hypothetical protein